MEAELEEFKKTLVSIDEGKMKVVFLVTSGRNGSNLVQSLVDGHPQVLMIPTLFWFYLDWKRLLEDKLHDKQELVETFISHSSFSLDWYTTGLGENKDEEIDLRRDELKERLIKLLNGLDEIDSKIFFVAVHYVYALLNNIDLSNIRCIFHHHHFPFTTFGYRYFTADYYSNYEEDGEFFKQALADFPKLKVLHMIRNPLATYNSSLLSIYNTDGSFDLKAYYYCLYGMLSGYFDALNKEFLYKDIYILIRFEDVHLRTSSVIQSLIENLEIDMSDKLHTSTIGGKLWWGNNPENMVNGPNAKMVNDKWKKNLDRQSLYLCGKMFNPILPDLKYERVKLPSMRNLYLPVKGEIRSYIKYIKSVLKNRIYKDLSFAWRYPLMRTSLVYHFYKMSKAVKAIQ